MDNSIISVLVGALISIVSGFITNHFANKRAKAHEESETNRLKIQTDSKELMQKMELSHNTKMQNYEVIMPAVKEVLTSLMEYYDCTKALVVNYPGTALTGQNPGLLFSKTLQELGTGFPNSLKELKNLDEDWLNKSLVFKKSFSINSSFLSKDMRASLEEFDNDAGNIKDYFYARYAGINDEQDFETAKLKYEKEKEDIFHYVKNEGYAAPTHSVLECYKVLENDKDKSLKRANIYIDSLIKD